MQTITSTGTNTSQGTAQMLDLSGATNGPLFGAALSAFNAKNSDTVFHPRPGPEQLRPDGPDAHGRPGRRIPIAAAVYNPFNLTVTLYPDQLVYLYARYRLVVNGSTPTGVAGTSGVLIDGAGTGRPGSDYVRDFGPEILAGPNFTGVTPAVAGFRPATSASPALSRSSVIPQASPTTPLAPPASAPRGYAGPTARAVDRVLDSFRKPRRWWA